MFKRIYLTSALFPFLLACSSGSSEEEMICADPCATTETETESDAETTEEQEEAETTKEQEEAETTATLPASKGPADNSSNITYDTGTSYDPVTGIFTITGLGLNAQMNRFDLADHGNFLAMRDAMGVHNAYFAQGQGTEVTVYSGGLAGNVLNIGSFSRTGPTELPLTGEAQFNGSYAGFTTTRRINGTAQLNVDFAEATVSGRITDRIFRQRPDNVADVVNPLSTLILEETSLLADGEFQGTTGGGQIVNGQTLWNPATGSYVGLVGGETGNEIVGTVAVSHVGPTGASFDEVGGFLARQ